MLSCVCPDLTHQRDLPSSCKPWGGIFCCYLNRNYGNSAQFTAALRQDSHTQRAKWRQLLFRVPVIPMQSWGCSLCSHFPFSSSWSQPQTVLYCCGKTAAPTKTAINWGLLPVSEESRISLGKEHGSTQADTAGEGAKTCILIHPRQQAEREAEPSPSVVTHFLQQDHSS